MFEMLTILLTFKFWLFTFLIFFVTFGYMNYDLIQVFKSTWRRDLRGFKAALKVLIKVITVEWKQETTSKLFAKTVKMNPNRIAFYFEDETWTFKQVEDYSNKIANYFIKLGYRKGDTVALLLENRPEYVAIWLGLSKIGIISALINTNLISKSLLHCLSAANAKTFIFGSNFADVVNDIVPNLDNVQLLQFNTSSNTVQVEFAVDFKRSINEQDVHLIIQHMDQPQVTDKLMYVFTSGTTGLPKAAKISHSRLLFMATGIYYLLNLTDDDILYNPLPLYHASGGVMTVGLCLIFGIPMTLRKKFSASNFWSDCIKYKCTASNYIGETCRYILEAHRGQKNIQHGVKKMFGNGLRKDIWKEFVETFNYPQMFEGYGSTEGNVNIINIDGKIGAVGFIPILLSKVFPLTIVKYSKVLDQPIKNMQGFCIPCKSGQPGLALGKINTKIISLRFTGYTNEKETNKKIFRNVFKKGDAYFNTGDVLFKDELNYVFFNDRLGDTYRWKGENVSTTEVECIASEIVGPKDLVVYGVEVPHYDGKAGMIGILDKNGWINRKKLAQGFQDNLPTYAIPIFLRRLKSMPLTSTFKIKKIELQKEGFDINLVADRLYIFNHKFVDYVPLANMYEDIMQGRRRI